MTESQAPSGGEVLNQVVELPSGAVLSLTPAPFVDARDLYKALLRDMKTIQLEFNLNSSLDLSHYLLKAFMGGLSSNEIEAAIWKCMVRCTYNGIRINKDTFEPIEARGDYINCLAKVVETNTGPFVKSLFAEFKKAADLMPKFSQKPVGN